MSESYSVKAILTADVNNFMNGFGMAKQAMESFQMGAGNLQNISKMAGAVGAGLTKGLTLPLAGIGAMSLKTFGGFEKQMNRVKAISGATGGEFMKLKDQAMELGAATIFSASEVAEGQEMMASAGFSVNEIFGAMPGVMDLAAVSSGDMALASEAVASAMNQFGLSGSKAAHVADVYARAAADTNAETADMAEAMKYAGPVAGALGISIEETAAAIGIMSNAGIKGSQAGTTLRSALSRLAAPTSEAKKLMNDLGINVFDANGKMLPMSETIPILQKAFSGLTDQQKQQAIETLFGKTAMSGMLALINSAPGEFDSLTTSLENSTGAAKEMADIMNSGLAGAIEELKGSLETAGIRIGEILSEMAIKAVGAIQSIVDGFNNLSPAMQQAIVMFGLIAAVIGPFLLIFSKIISTIALVKGAFVSLQAVVTGIATTAVPLLKGAFMALGTAIKAVIAFLLANPWVAVIALIAAAVTAIIMNWDKIKPALSAIWEAVKSKASQAWETIKTTITNIVDSIRTAVSEKFNDMKTKVQSVLDSMKTAVSDKFDDMKSKIQSAMDDIKTKVKTAWDDIKSKVTDVLNAIKEAVTSKFNDIKLKVTEVMDNVKKEITNKFNDAKREATNAVNNIKTAITDAFTQVVNTVKNKMRDVVNSVKEGFSNALNAARGFIGRAVSVGRDLIQGFVNGVKAAAGRLISAVSSAVSGAINRAKALLRIGSPSKLFKQFGGWTLEGYAIGLEKEEKTVFNQMKSTIKGISDIANNTNLSDLSNLSSLSGSTNASIEHSLKDNSGQPKPAYINLSLGGRNYRAFVEDISNIQGVEANLEEAFGF